MHGSNLLAHNPSDEVDLKGQAVRFRWLQAGDLNQRCRLLERPVLGTESRVLFGRVSVREILSSAQNSNPVGPLNLGNLELAGEAVA